MQTSEILHCSKLSSTEPQLSPAPNPLSTTLERSGYPAYNSDAIVNGIDAELVLPYFLMLYGVLALSNFNHLLKKSVMNLFA